MSARAIIAGLSPVEADSPAGAVIARHVLDAAATLHAARRTAEGAAIARLFGDAEPALRAAGEAAVIRFSECDSIELAGCVTPGSIAIPVAAGFARDEDSLASAIVAGYAVAIAIGRAVGGAEALTRGVWPTLLAAPAIAAVTTSVALGLDDDVTADALALALSAASGRAGRPGGRPSGRWFLVGEATLKGIRAAFAAREGVAGDPELPSADWLVAQAGTPAEPVRSIRLPADPAGEVGLKPYVSARQGANAIRAFIDLLDQGLDPASIESIDVALPPIALPVVSRPLRLDDRLSTIAHLGLQLGIAVFERERLLDIGREAPFHESSLALAGRVSVAADVALAAGPPNTWPARVVVRTGSGRTFETICSRLPGDAGDPYQATVVEAKLERFCGTDHRLAATMWRNGKWSGFLDAGFRQFAGGSSRPVPRRASG